MAQAFKQFCFYIFVAGIFTASPFIATKYLFESTIMVTQNDRGPSSIQKVFDYSSLVGNALEAAAQARLSNSVSVINSKDEVALLMGNFVLMNEENEKQFACGYYDKLNFVFEAQGVSVGGESPILTVVAECDVATNINMMNPIKLPLAELKKQKPSNTEFKFFDSGKSLTLSLSHSPASWPTQWVLKSVKMTNSKFLSRLLVVPTRQISMNW